MEAKAVNGAGESQVLGPDHEWYLEECHVEHEKAIGQNTDPAEESKQPPPNVIN